MTEDKRFYLDENGINDREYEFSILGEDELVDIINDLNDENGQLKMGIDSLKLLVQNWEALDEEKDGQLDRQNQALKKLKKENEQLRKDATTLIYANQDYRHENEQLKSEIEKLSYANEDLLEEKRIWKQMSDEYTKLSYENEQLKQRIFFYKNKVKE